VSALLSIPVFVPLAADAQHLRLGRAVDVVIQKPDPPALPRQRLGAAVDDRDVVVAASGEQAGDGLADVAGAKIDEVFIGSCMTNIGHFRAAAKLLGGQRDIPVKLWVAPPTKMDQQELVKEGHYAAFGTAGARTEQPGCSLCMGNQAQVREGATVVSTSTRNFPHRPGIATPVYLSSAELAAVTALMGKIPTVAEYMEQVKTLESKAADVYRYMNFDQIEEYAETAKAVAG